MNPEPLKDKSKHIYQDYWYFEYYEIKSAVEWLEKRTYVIEDVRVVDWDNVKEAFEDVIKK